MIKNSSLFVSLYEKGDTPSDHIRKGVFYEEEIFQKFIANIPNQGTFLDIGANIGNHTVMFNQYFPDRKIISFEANPFNYSKLCLNTQTISNVLPICCGLSNKMELVTFIHFAPSPGCSRIIDYYGDTPGDSSMCNTHISACPKVNIILQPLDVFNLTDVSFIKMDVEGHELQVIKGAIETIKTKPVIWIEDFEYSKNRENSATQYLINELNYSILDSDIDDNYLLG